jgi:hypothetical protein
MGATVSAGRPENWDGLEPPPWELPGIVPLEQILTRSDDVVVSVGQIRVFSTGALVTFEIRLGKGCEDDPDYTEDLYWLLTTRGRPPTPGGPTLGVRAPDGAATTATGRPRRPNLDMRAGGSNGPIWRFTYWLSPTPLEDTTFVGAWPTRGIPAGAATISGEHLRTAHHGIQPL